MASLLPAEEALVVHAVGEAGPSYPDVLEQPQVHDLMLDAPVVDQRRRLVLVRLDATHVVRLLEEGEVRGFV